MLLILVTQLYPTIIPYLTLLDTYSTIITFCRFAKLGNPNLQRYCCMPQIKEMTFRLDRDTKNIRDRTFSSRR